MNTTFGFTKIIFVSIFIGDRTQIKLKFPQTKKAHSLPEGFSSFFDMPSCGGTQCYRSY
jgi:hypothetical protein